MLPYESDTQTKLEAKHAYSQLRRAAFILDQKHILPVDINELKRIISKAGAFLEKVTPEL